MNEPELTVALIRALKAAVQLAARLVGLALMIASAAICLYCQIFEVHTPWPVLVGLSWGGLALGLGGTNRQR